MRLNDRQLKSSEPCLETRLGGPTNCPDIKTAAPWLARVTGC